MAEQLLSVLRKAQKKHGYLPEDVLKQISTKTNTPISRVYGTATFYTMLRTEKHGKNIIEICGSPSCYLNGSLNIEKFLEKELKLKIGETTKNKKFSLYKTSCIGCCDKAPAMMVNGKLHTSLDVEKVKEILKKCKS